MAWVSASGVLGENITINRLTATQLNFNFGGSQVLEETSTNVFVENVPSSRDSRNNK